MTLLKSILAETACFQLLSAIKCLVDTMISSRKHAKSIASRHRNRGICMVSAGVKGRGLCVAGAADAVRPVATSRAIARWVILLTWHR